MPIGCLPYERRRLAIAIPLPHRFEQAFQMARISPDIEQRRAKPIRGKFVFDSG
jgi:hypothetical protein